MEHECCLCLKSETQLQERLKQYGTYWCCRACLAGAVSVAYFAACRLSFANKDKA